MDLFSDYSDAIKMDSVSLHCTIQAWMQTRTILNQVQVLQTLHTNIINATHFFVVYSDNGFDHLYHELYLSEISDK